jgi:hypothetical protein
MCSEFAVGTALTAESQMQLVPDRTLSIIALDRAQNEEGWISGFWKRTRWAQRELRTNPIWQ